MNMNYEEFENEYFSRNRKNFRTNGDIHLTLLRCPRSSGGSLRSLTASITEASRSFVTFLPVPGGEDGEDEDEDEDEDADRLPTAAADEEAVFLAAKRSAMALVAHTPKTGNLGPIRFHVFPPF